MPGRNREMRMRNSLIYAIMTADSMHKERKAAMTLYVTRHGETVLNERHRVSGLGDVPLTERGRAQARELARRAAEKDIDLIIASPLQRAWETARAVAEVRGIPMVAEPRLRELDYGSFDRAAIDDPAFLRIKRRFAWHMGGGESVLTAAARVYPCLEEIRRNYPDKNILIVCHGTVCRLIHAYFHDLTDEEFWASIPDNCELREYEW